MGTINNQKSEICIIAAVSKDGFIGKDGQLPWDRLPGDLPRFKATTVGSGNNAVIYGRKTAESMGNRTLPGRKNCILTRNNDYIAPEGAEKFPDLNSAIEACKNYEQTFIIGGESVFKEALSISDKIILTLVNYEVNANPQKDAKFPEFDQSEWEEVERLQFPEWEYDVVTYQRR